MVAPLGIAENSAISLNIQGIKVKIADSDRENSILGRVQCGSVPLRLAAT